MNLCSNQHALSTVNKRERGWRCPAKTWEGALGFLRKPSKNFKQGGVMACFKNLSAVQRMNCKNENVETY